MPTLRTAGGKMIEDIADLIVELAKERKEIDDPVRAIYTVLMDVDMAVGRRMEKINDQRRKSNG